MSSGYEVYDRLSPSFAKYLEGLEAYHEAHWFNNYVTFLGNKLRDGESPVAFLSFPALLMSSS